MYLPPILLPYILYWSKGIFSHGFMWHNLPTAIFAFFSVFPWVDSKEWREWGVGIKFWGNTQRKPETIILFLQCSLLPMRTISELVSKSQSILFSLPPLFSGHQCFLGLVVFQCKFRKNIYKLLSAIWIKIINLVPPRFESRIT